MGGERRRTPHNPETRKPGAFVRLKMDINWFLCPNGTKVNYTVCVWWRRHGRERLRRSTKAGTGDGTPLKMDI